MPTPDLALIAKSKTTVRQQAVAECDKEYLRQMRIIMPQGSVNERDGSRK